jgi:GT2 family glycosyltransferase
MTVRLSENPEPVPAPTPRGRQSSRRQAEKAPSGAASRRALLVAGMHRSGTSALARVLSLRGAALPQNVLPPNYGNPTGYWEPEAIVAFNDRVLEYFGVVWDNPFAAGRLPAADAFPVHFQDEAEELLAREYADADLFVLKDPRCTLLHAFWRRALRATGTTVCPVVAIRPFAEVTESLVRRDGTSAASAALLYVGYGLEAANLVSAGASVVTYAQLLADWRGTTDRIATEQQISWPISSARAANEIEAFLQPASAPGARIPQLPEALTAWTNSIWSWFEAAAQGRTPPLSALDGVRSEVGDAMELFAPVLADRDERIRGLARRADSAEQKERVEESLRASLTRVESLEGELEHREGEVQRLASELRGRDEELERRDARLQQRDAELQAVRREVERAKAELAAIVAEREKLLGLQHSTESELIHTQQQYRALERQLDEVAGALTDARAQAQQTRLLVEQLETDLQGYRKRESGLSTSLELARNGLAAAREELGDAQATITRIDAQRDRFQSELEVIYASRSWRITAPLRGAARLGRQLLERPYRRLLLPAPAPEAPRARIEPPAMPVAPRLLEPAFEQRPHAGLRAFLIEEFGSHAAEEVVQRIDHYRLPMPTAEIRAASAGACSEADAVAWATAIARRARHRIDTEAVPEVSIVLPVYGQVGFTLACIDALVMHRSRHSFEILVGDDASPDATATALAVQINGVRHIRHSANLGFVRNCNATATLARGRFVVLLNNDTQVLPGWLDELVDTLQRDPGIGLAGSKLVYPDGRLQECGGIVWRDGSAWNFGRLEDPRRPEFCYLRDVDYVSGASIALRRPLWEELGGFDELFVPAYAEDVDLAFRVRARGLRTVVQPLSQLLHFEGISSGTDLGQGAKAHQVANLRKFHERWQEVLAGHRDNADRPDLEKERSVGKRMLFVDLVTPIPNEDAGSLVVHEMMSAFQDCGFKITFIPEDNFAHMGATTRDLQRLGIEAIYHPAWSSLPDFAADRRDPFDVILLVRFRVGEAHLEMLRRAYPQARILFSNCDLHYLREMREAELSGDAGAMAAARETKRREIAVIAGADLNLVHSDAELELLRKDVPAAPTVLFPLVHDPVAHCPPLDAREGTCFIGSYRHPPNADGISWFVERIWPRVRQRLPSEKLYIAGSGMTEEIRALSKHANVHVVGFVDDLEAFLAERRATIAPLRFGAGAKGKVAASLANGVPVVSTSIGAEGMQLTAGGNVLVADEEDAFAASLVEVLSSDRLWQQLSAAGLTYAADVTSRRAARVRARDICARLGVDG